MNLPTRVLLFACCIYHSTLPVLQAQPKDASFKRYTSEDGLESSHITAISQDHQGFMWVGTGSGLFRFDGYSFKAFKNVPADTTSISDNFINALYEDSRPEGKLWVGATNGLNAFDFRTEKFTHYRNEQPGADLTRLNFVRTLRGGEQRTIWVGTHGGAFRFDETTQRFARAELPIHSLLSREELLEASAILTEGDGTMWIGTIQQGLFKYDPQSGSFQQFQHDPSDPLGLGSNKIIALAQDHNGTIWVGTHNGGLARVSADRKRVTAVPVAERDRRNFSVIGSIVEDPEGILWLGSSGEGLIAYESQTGAYAIFRSTPSNPHTLSNDWILAQYVDRAGNLWIGTNSGLNKLLMPRRKIGHLTNIPGNPQSLIHSSVNAITEDHQGQLWIGTPEGISVFDAGSKFLRHYKKEAGNANSLSLNFVQALHEDKYGDMWIGTFGGGLNRLDRARRTFTHFRRDTSEAGSLTQNFVTHIYEDHAGDLWIGTLGGLNKFDRTRNRFVRYLSNSANAKSLSQNGITWIYEDRANRFWIGTYGGGLNRMERSTAEFTHYKNERTNPNSLSDNIIYCVVEDENGILWIGTNGGLNRFDPATEQFDHYLEPDGLPNNVVFGILGEFGAQRKLWISTHSGLCTFNDLLPAGQKFAHFDARKDGLQANEFNQCAFYQSRSGELFFGGPNGVNRFYSQDLKTKSALPNVALIAFNKFNKAVTLDASLSALPELKLSHDDVFFSFEFAVLDFTLPERNEYAYKMEGFNQNWIYSGTQHNATFTNLAPGPYVFRVKGANSDGVWNEDGVALRILIAPPLWQTLWFRLAMAGGVLLLVYGLYRLRLTKLLAIERLRVRIASDLHDDIGATLTKISLHTELIQDGACSPEIIASLRKIGAMSRELVTTMSDVVWSIDARNDTVGNLLDRMREFAASVLAPQSVTFTFNSSGLELQKKLPVDIRQNLYLIFKEAINNVARHAEASYVDIRLENASGAFKMTIHDDGVVLAETEKPTGHGLRNMKMRARHLGGQLEIVPNGGWTVHLTARQL